MCEIDIYSILCNWHCKEFLDKGIDARVESNDKQFKKKHKKLHRLLIQAPTKSVMTKIYRYLKNLSETKDKYQLYGL
jgi:hypothetical protein